MAVPQSCRRCRWQIAPAEEIAIPQVRIRNNFPGREWGREPRDPHNELDEQEHGASLTGSFAVHGRIHISPLRYLVHIVRRNPKNDHNTSDKNPCTIGLLPWLHYWAKDDPFQL
ncbi:hypothetical protein MPTK1_6g05090 [Marchantia polymorpha subsp. ruderalis]|uniref:Uncharacterized protein n=1 Tax=Marchantia polymorpha subsp. ruderalis TaxID=1480154 RepID=A0AAF6BNP6_MARPO|nr:hypothetical protein Mp_6g05090 [Marchantia polymorpha subsp. ruderalis]